MFDRAVLARGIHRLKYQQHGPAVLRVKFLLHRGQFLHAELQILGRLFLGLEAGGVARIEVLQPKLGPIGYAKRFNESPSLAHRDTSS